MVNNKENKIVFLKFYKNIKLSNLNIIISKCRKTLIPMQLIGSYFKLEAVLQFKKKKRDLKKRVINAKKKHINNRIQPNNYKVIYQSQLDQNVFSWTKTTPGWKDL